MEKKLVPSEKCEMSGISGISDQIQTNSNFLKNLAEFQ